MPPLHPMFYYVFDTISPKYKINQIDLLEQFNKDNVIAEVFLF